MQYVVQMPIFTPFSVSLSSEHANEILADALGSQTSYIRKYERNEIRPTREQSVHIRGITGSAFCLQALL
jgi:hypothetical protein